MWHAQHSGMGVVSLSEGGGVDINFETLILQINDHENPPPLYVSDRLLSRPLERKYHVTTSIFSLHGHLHSIDQSMDVVVVSARSRCNII